MKKRLMFLILCLSAVALVAAGCGDDETETTSDAPATTATQAETASDIVATAQGSEDLSTLVAAVTAADLVETLQGEGPFTVFAPTNDGFAAIQDTVDTLLKPENKDDLKNVLTYHVVPGSYPASSLEDGQELTTVQGEKLTVSIDGDVVKINDATVEKADTNASNGVVHIIDGVLVPPAT